MRTQHCKHQRHSLHTHIFLRHLALDGGRVLWHQGEAMLALPSTVRRSAFGPALVAEAASVQLEGTMAAQALARVGAGVEAVAALVCPGSGASKR